MRTPDDIHDEWLVLKCQEGDTAALIELVDRWQPRLLRHAMRLTDLPDAAGDVVQAAWVAILRGLNQIDDPACFRRWAYQIATYKCADWVRDRQRVRASFVPLVTDPIDASAIVNSSNDTTDLLSTAIRLLPPDYRVLLSMFYIDDMSTAEIADSLAIPVGTVKSRLHLARSKLKQIIERKSQ